MEFDPLKLIQKRFELNSDGKKRKSHKEKKLTMRDAAEMIGVHFTTLQRWEAGSVNPKVNDAYKIAEAYGVEISYFMSSK